MAKKRKVKVVKVKKYKIFKSWAFINKRIAAIKLKQPKEVKDE